MVLTCQSPVHRIDTDVGLVRGEGRGRRGYVTGGDRGSVLTRAGGVSHGALPGVRGGDHGRVVTAAGRGHVYRGAVIGVSGSLPVVGGRANGDHSVAVTRGVRASVSAGVPSRGHQHHSARARPIDGLL